MTNPSPEANAGRRRGVAALRARADAGKMLAWVLLFVVAAVVVVVGGVYFG